MSNLLYLLNEKDNKQSKKSYISSISNITNDKPVKEYQNDIDIKTSYKIYVQSIEKTVELLKDIINILEDQNFAENSEILSDSIHKKN